MGKKILRIYSNNENITIIGTILILLTIGTTLINSATQTMNNNLHYTQMNMVWIFAGLFIMFFCSLINLKKVYNLYILLYIFSNLLLILIKVYGLTVAGAQSWISIGGIKFQPSEFAKLCTILFLSKFISDNIENLNNPKTLTKILGYAMIPVVLVIIQPDFGTAMVMLFIIAGILIVSNINAKYIGIFIATTIASLPLLWLFLKDYQRKRILVFFNPNMDPLGSGYNVIQSKIAIGSGKLLGKGLFMGTQNNLNFIPKAVKHSDFIFAILGEELGLIGCITIIVLFVILIGTIIKIEIRCKQDAYIITVMGIALMFIFHIIENIGMTIGLLPCTGIPLPFVSYGGSALITNMAAIGIILNINSLKN